MSVFKFFEENSVPNKSNANGGLNTFDLTLQPNKNQRYEIDYVTKFYALDQLAAHVKTKIIWLLKVIDRFEDGYIIDIEVLDHQVSNANPAFTPMLNFLKVFNYPTEVLVIKLNSKGVIERILNQEEILERWNKIKVDELRSLDQTEEDRQLLEKGDLQFSNTLQAVKESLLHTLFFSLFYGSKSIGTEQYVGNVSYLSQIFQGALLNYELTEEVLNINNNTMNLSYLAKVNNQTNINFNYLYDQQFRELCGAEFDYQNFYKANYELDVASGLINKCKANFFEKANDKLFFEADYNIKLI